MKRLLATIILGFASLASAQNPMFFQSAYSTMTAATPPTFSPVAGAVANPTTVTASSTTSGSGCVMYLDTNSTPTTAQTTYSVTTPVTLYAQVRGCIGYGNSAIASASYTISGPTVFNSFCQVLSGANYTTTPISTIGANLIVVMVSNYTGINTITDNESNGTASTAVVLYGGTNNRSTLYYYAAPTVGASHTFSINTGAAYRTVCVYPVSGVTGAFDTGVTSASTGTGTCQAGSITPGSGTHIVFAGNEILANGVTPTIDSSYTLSSFAQGQSAVNIGVGAAYLVQNPGATTNPTWTSASATMYCGLASFR